MRYSHFGWIISNVSTLMALFKCWRVRRLLSNRYTFAPPQPMAWGTAIYLVRWLKDAVNWGWRFWPGLIRHAIHQDAATAHPEWIAVDAEGNPRRHWSMPDVWVTCALGPYNFEFMTDVHREIVSRYKVDGIFSNRWAGHGVCYCRALPAQFL